MSRTSLIRFDYQVLIFEVVPMRFWCPVCCEISDQTDSVQEQLAARCSMVSGLVLHIWQMGFACSPLSDDAICCHDFPLEKQPEENLAFVLHLEFPDPGPSEVRVGMGSPKLNCIR